MLVAEPWIFSVSKKLLHGHVAEHIKALAFLTSSSASLSDGTSIQVLTEYKFELRRPLTTIMAISKEILITNKTIKQAEYKHFQQPWLRYPVIIPNVPTATTMDPIIVPQNLMESISKASTKTSSPYFTAPKMIRIPPATYITPVIIAKIL